MGSNPSQLACPAGHSLLARLGAVCALVLGSLGADLARATDHATAADQLARGYNQFFEAVRKTPDASDAAVAGYYSDHVAGPARAVQQSQVDASREVMRQMGVKVIKSDSPAREPASAGDSGGDASDLSWAWGKEKDDEKKEAATRAPARAGEDSGYAAATPALAPAPAAPALEPVVVDGSEVPRELEFPGPKR